MKNLTNVMNVGKPSVRALILLYIRESIQEKNPINVMSVGKPLFRGQVSFDIKESTVEKNLNPQEFREKLQSYIRR